VAAGRVAVRVCFRLSQQSAKLTGLSKKRNMSKKGNMAQLRGEILACPPHRKMLDTA
jgi:hypothetical protein